MIYKKVNFIYALLIITIIAGALAYYLVEQELGFIYTPSVLDKSQNEITQDQAIKVVSDLPEVENFFTQTEKKHGHPLIGVSATTDKDTFGVYWTVQVYQNLSGKNSTFAWYQVYVDTGKILNLSKDD